MKTSILFAIALLLSGASHATIIYNNGSESTKLPALSDVGGPYFVADDFSLDVGQNTIRSVHWWGGYGGQTPPEPDHFVIALYEEVSGAPASYSFYQFQVQTYTRESWWRTDYFNNELFFYSAFIDPITLTPDTTYYLSIWDNDPVGPDWNWSESCYNCSDNYSRNSLGAAWEPDWQLQRLAFYMTDDRAPIPEPTTLSIMALGVAGLGLRRLKRMS